MTALLALHVACGIVLGIVYFGSLWFNTRLYERAGACARCWPPWLPVSSFSAAP